MITASTSSQDDKDWYESKQFKDPVYGYITLNRAYTKNLIDTQKMQRIKGVAQTGIRPVFPSATHERFSHSLGVYKFGMEIYSNLSKQFKTCILELLKEKKYSSMLKDSKGKVEYMDILERKLNHWRNLLAIACLLHDIGHPVQSHSFEFLYDDCYLDTQVNQGACQIDQMGHDELTRIYKAFVNLPEREEQKHPGNLSVALLPKIKSNEFISPDKLPGSPHERMSAYYILTDQALQDNIKKLISHTRFTDYDETVDEDIEFIIRMILGWEYSAEERLSFDRTNFYNSAKNCIIHILNGNIDADGMDYLMRNAYSAGYDTSKVDNARLCKAYTVYERNYKLFPAFSKSALSVLEGYITARNFEPTWLYSHHKVVYADLLTKQLYKYLTKYLVDQTMLCSSVQLFVKHANQSAIVWQPETDDVMQSFDQELMLQMPRTKRSPCVSLTAQKLHSHLLQISYPVHTYLLAPCRHYQLGTHHFYHTTDADLEAMIRWIQNELECDATDDNKAYNTYMQRLRSIKWTDIKHKLSTTPTSDKALRTLCAEELLFAIKTRFPNYDLTAYTQEQTCLRQWIDNPKSTDLQPFCSQIIDAIASAPHADQADIKEMLTRFCNVKDNSEDALLECWLSDYQPLLSKDDYVDFKRLLREYETRNYRTSMWKSYAEYRLFLSDCASDLAVSQKTIHRYMLDLINPGMEERGFSIFEGTKVENTPENYREQFYYLPSRSTASLPPSPPEEKRSFLEYWVRKLFRDIAGKYDFSYNNLVIKLCKMKTKQFEELNLLFDKRPVPLASMISIPKGSYIQFPYIYYRSDENLNSDPKLIQNNFRQQFIEYCKAARSREVRSVNIMNNGAHIFHDAVHGDITMPDKFYAIVRTAEFQRLGRIKQLATADRSFPGATHTRLSHSLGTWYVMKLILDHFAQYLSQYPHMQAPTEQQRNAALLAALLHDLGHGPYSHAFEKVGNCNHEATTLKIMQDPKTAIHMAIIENFDQSTLETTLQLLDASQELLVANRLDIYVIYQSLISSQLDADRIDYIMRDNSCCGMSYGHIDLAQIIASMRLLPQYENNSIAYCLCFDDRYLTAIDQFIYARYQMYQNIYHDPQKMLYESLFATLIEQACSLQDSIQDEGVFPILRKFHDKGYKASVEEYLQLDDESVNGLIRKWADGTGTNNILRDDMEHTNNVQTKARILHDLARMFLGYECSYIQVDLGAEIQSYDMLAKRVSKQLNASCSTMMELSKEYISFCFISNSNYAYKRQTNKNKIKENILLRNVADGTITDYISRSSFRLMGDKTEKENLWETDFRYLFFSQTILEEECKLKLDQMKPMPSLAKQVIREVEAAEPRHHIEIEKKYYCEIETINEAKKHIEQLSTPIDSLFAKPSFVDNHQEDTYYDFYDAHCRLLYEHDCTFRCRFKDKKYVFTMKLPTASTNYTSEHQLARYEYEYQSTSNKVDDNVFEFMKDTLRLLGQNEWASKVTRNDLKPLIVVVNKRSTTQLLTKESPKPVCEICLDTIEYQDPHTKKQIGDYKYQIEIELLAEPEYWLELEGNLIKQFERHFADRLQLTSDSKLKTGLSILDSQQNS